MLLFCFSIIILFILLCNLFQFIICFLIALFSGLILTLIFTLSIKLNEYIAYSFEYFSELPLNFSLLNASKY